MCSSSRRPSLVFQPKQFAVWMSQSISQLKIITLDMQCSLKCPSRPPFDAECSIEKLVFSKRECPQVVFLQINTFMSVIDRKSTVRSSVVGNICLPWNHNVNFLMLARSLGWMSKFSFLSARLLFALFNNHCQSQGKKNSTGRAIKSCCCLERAWVYIIYTPGHHFISVATGCVTEVWISLLPINQGESEHFQPTCPPP